MEYKFNMKSLQSTFALPREVAEKHLKLAPFNALKVLLYCFSNLADGIDKLKIAEALSVKESDVEDALTYWCEAGVLIAEETAKKEAEKEIVIKSELPSRTDILRRSMEDKNITLLLREAQLKFGRNLKQNESSLLVSLYDDSGMKASVILMLLQYAKTNDRLNLSYIRSLAASWLKAGVETVADAEKVIAESVKSELAWKTVMRVFGIENRKPSEKELSLSNKWINEWKLSESELKSAYDTCVDSTAKLSFAYIEKVLEAAKNGEKSGKKEKKSGKKNDFAGFDIDLFNELANKD